MHLVWILRTLPLFSPTTFANPQVHDNDDGLFRFVSRPDIRAPKWNLNIQHPDLISPGYWFVAPFEFIDQRDPGNGWIGPHIYDGNGTLIWSGVHINRNRDAIDFKLSNVRGENLLTFVGHEEGSGFILDETYQLREKVELGNIRLDFNSHEFYFLENGTRAISMTDNPGNATREQAEGVGWDIVDGEKPCRAQFNGFKVWDTATWTKLWEWKSQDHVSLNESSFHDQNCSDSWGWDFIHLNAVDKDHNGDYYVSARHTDTIYKVSKDDGHIIWRLQGMATPWSDFNMNNVRFRRQHNVRFRGFNGTHEFITLLDNGKGQDSSDSDLDFRHSHSRALTLSLSTQVFPMTAHYEQIIHHPDGNGSYAFRRGNYEILPDGNHWIGWSEQALHSEHTPSGDLIFSARMQTEWLGTYRSYKFPFIGLPAERPVAVAGVYPSKIRNSSTTLIHVSWNGATEVKEWEFYSISEDGNKRVKIGRKGKEGFETSWAWDGVAEYILCEALDASGVMIGRSEIVRVRGERKREEEGHEKERYWLDVDVGGRSFHWAAGEPISAFVVGAVCGLGILGIGPVVVRLLGSLGRRKKGWVSPKVAGKRI